MSSTRSPIRDLGPEFLRRLDRDVQRFTRRMFEIGRDADRFDRAERIQAECDRLLSLSDEEARHAAAS